MDGEKVVVNGTTVVRRAAEADWLADIYRAIGMQYPKFFKMDNLCKAGTLAAELLLRDIDFDRENVKPDWAVILMNSASSTNKPLLIRIITIPVQRCSSIHWPTS